MVKSDEFGAIVSTVIGPLGLRDAAVKAGISAAYMGQMKAGIVPSEEVLSKFAAGFGLTGQLAEQYWRAASAVKPEADLENVIQFACDAAGFSTMQRWAVIECFRAQREQSERGENSNAA